MYNELMINESLKNDQISQFSGDFDCEPLPADFVPSRGLFAKQDALKKEKRQKRICRLISIFHMAPSTVRLAAE